MVRNGLAVVIIAILIIGGTIGWGQSVYKLIQCDFASPYKAEVVYLVGTIVPVVGGVVGWIDVED